MLKSVEILIGLSVIMLVLSMVVTMLTQFVTSVCNTRGRHLKNGLGDLLKQIDPRLEEQVAEKIATQILTHPVIRETSLPFLKRMGSVIQREEFTKLLLELAAGDGPHPFTPEDAAKVQKQLSDVVSTNGITNPSETLQTARMLALKLEASNPQLSNNVRQGMALLQEASSPLTAKINAWFDEVMDRTSDRFTFTTRGITFVCAAVVAIALQVDTVGLVNRLATDDQLRTEMGQLANKVMEGQNTDRAIQELAADPGFADLPDEVKQRRVLANAGAASQFPADPKALNDLIARRATRDFVGAPEFMQATPEQQRAKLQAFRKDLAQAPPQQLDQLIREYSRPEITESQKQYLSFLSNRGLVTLPQGGNWRASFGEKNVFGIIVSALLLSLGAPFWYSMLSRAINLRSVLAGKEDKQREERQTTQEGSQAKAA